jgi:hypothetical protein
MHCALLGSSVSVAQTLLSMLLNLSSLVTSFVRHSSNSEPYYQERRVGFSNVLRQAILPVLHP